MVFFSAHAYICVTFNCLCPRRRLREQNPMVGPNIPREKEQSTIQIQIQTDIQYTNNKGKLQTHIHT